MSVQTFTATTVATEIYQSSGNTAITFMSFCNYSTDTVTANVFVVPAGTGGSAATNNIVYQNLQLTPGDTYQLYAGGEKLLFSNGDGVYANVSANAAVTIVTSYTSI